MGRKMTRGKQQILFNYLPGRTFDFEKLATIARVSKISGIVRSDLNAQLILKKISEDAHAWGLDFRPALRDEVLRDPRRFILLEPAAVSAQIFPRILWCQSKRCGRIVNAENFDTLPSKCPECHAGYLVQLRFVRIHRCGALDPVTAPFCQTCKTSRFVSLDTRGGERFAAFLWTCTKCKTRLTYFPGPCRSCQWPISQDSGPRIRNCDVEVHRAGRTFYAQSTVLLNIPNRQLDALFAQPDWPLIVAAKYLEFHEAKHISLLEFSRTQSAEAATSSGGGLSNVELDDLLRKQASGEITAEQMVAEMQRLRLAKSAPTRSNSNLGQQVVERSGVPSAIWERAGYELFESILPAETQTSISLASINPEADHVAQGMGLHELTLESDYPIINATYAYTRSEYRPNECRLNPFPQDTDHGGKFPIFVDEVQADALLVRLSPRSVYEWLLENGAPAQTSTSQDDTSVRSFFVKIFDGLGLKETLGANDSAARMTFGLLHTLSHVCVRRAALLCGLDHTSLSEYLLPRSLTFAIYCNHRFGATIGALTALFEQSPAQWLTSVTNSKKCIYDPVCKDAQGSCHACTHLAETSCRFFNLNLNRAFLFGGFDPQLGTIRKGYLQLTKGR
jgi:hypothetical protein